MTSSGQYNFGLTNAGIIIDAFERIQIDPVAITMRQMQSARVSLNLELLEWSNLGFNFWELMSGTINLAVNTPTYVLPANLVVLTDIWYSLVNGAGTGVNQDRIMIPITREEYAMIPNKLQPGIPTQYWLQMLSPPQVTIWEVPQAGQVAPNAVMNWYGLRQIMDANLTPGETPDIHYRATEALISGLTLRLCEKFGPTEPQARTAMLLEKKTIADRAWENLVRRDQEPGALMMRPNIAAYGRL
jgi:hypothetical protein